MFPNETLDGGIFRNGFVGSSNSVIFGLWAFHWSVINVGNGDVRNFGLKDICDVIVEDGYQIRTTHWKGDNAKCAEGGLKSSKILQ
jgi:hypothetical protein